jgi:hypothetical protein
MKYSNIIGIVAALFLMYACTEKWIYIEQPEFYLTGFKSTTVDNIFGRPGILHIAFCLIAIVLFIIPKVWAKRTNFVFTALNLAWGIKNFSAIGFTCRGGICPTALWPMYVILICSITIFVMSLLPKLEVKQTK